MPLTEEKEVNENSRTACIRSEKRLMTWIGDQMQNQDSLLKWTVCWEKLLKLFIILNLLLCSGSSNNSRHGGDTYMDVKQCMCCMKAAEEFMKAPDTLLVGEENSHCRWTLPGLEMKPCKACHTVQSQASTRFQGLCDWSLCARGRQCCRLLIETLIWHSEATQPLCISISTCG